VKAPAAPYCDRPNSALTLTFGPVPTLNVLLTLAYGLSAWSAYLAIRR
jgi:hypothetical protein